MCYQNFFFFKSESKAKAYVHLEMWCKIIKTEIVHQKNENVLTLRPSKM